MRGSASASCATSSWSTPTATADPWSDAVAARTTAFVATLGVGPGPEPTPYVLLTLLPRRIQVWRTVEEIDGRDVMRDGVWLAERP